MRFQASIELDKPELPRDFRRMFLSLLKTALTEVGGDLLRGKYFGTSEIKPFAVGIYLPRAKFSDTVMMAEPFIRLTFSTDTFPVFCDLYNAFNGIRGKKVTILSTEFTVRSITMVNSRPVDRSEIVAKFDSPLAVRLHNEYYNTDKYYTCEDEGFEQHLRKTVAAQLERLGKDPALAETLHVIDVSSARKTVLFHYGEGIPVTIGRIRLSGDIGLLEWLHQVGIGSRRSAGFGLFDWEVGA